MSGDWQLLRDARDVFVHWWGIDLLEELQKNYAYRTVVFGQADREKICRSIVYHASKPGKRWWTTEDQPK